MSYRLPYKCYYLPVVLLSLSGALDSLYLFFSHYQNYTNLTYSSFCAISRTINCDTVAQSEWAIFWGLPVALWGLLGYLMFFFILIPLRKPEKDVLPLWNLLVFIGIFFALTAIFFGYISATQIHSYCILCIFSYAASFSLFYLSWLIQKRFCSTTLFAGFIGGIKILFQNKCLAVVLTIMLASTISLRLFLPTYWNLELSQISYELPHGLTEDRHPWIGAENPVLTIHEFSDYMCFQCHKMHFFLRRLVQRYPNSIRLVHRHFPMDPMYNPIVTEKYHGGSGKMAMIALYAANKNQFWRVNDLLFDIASHKKDFNTRTIAEVMGIPAGELTAVLKNKYVRLRLKHDIAIAIEKGLKGTPSFIIDDAVFLGTIPKDILQKGMQETTAKGTQTTKLPSASK